MEEGELKREKGRGRKEGWKDEDEGRIEGAGGQTLVWKEEGERNREEGRAWKDEDEGRIEGA